MLMLTMTYVYCIFLAFCLILPQGLDPMSKDCEGLTALHWASAFGKSFASQLLLKHSHSASIPRESKGSLEDLINEDDKCSILQTMQPLHISAAVGSVAMVELLLGAGAEVCLSEAWVGVCIGMEINEHCFLLTSPCLA